ncbi:hypothetical protein [Brucella anthropi]|uniref:hypothetical protein n=2 Tax=Brucella/Ochrobactrum group TaxID=2826938 RepID=UPI002165F552|nr:hypothetical protein [Brucella anthropi]UVV68196.1 hypothetical protein NW321_03475 [Brucella anthropi]
MHFASEIPPPFGVFVDQIVNDTQRSIFIEALICQPVMQQNPDDVVTRRLALCSQTIAIIFLPLALFAQTLRLLPVRCHHFFRLRPHNQSMSPKTVGAKHFSAKPRPTRKRRLPLNRKSRAQQRLPGTLQHSSQVLNRITANYFDLKRIVDKSK